MRRRPLVATLILAPALALAAGLGWLLCRPNRAEIDPRLALEHWDAVDDGEHNSNTDLIAWRDGLLLVHAASPWHLGSTRSRLRILHSRDGRRWESLATLHVHGSDIRDPKLAVHEGRLFLFALPNDTLYATPTHTVLATSPDAREWTPFEPVGPEGWLFWRPKTRDGRTWYAPAYWHGHGESILLRSEDLVHWERVSVIHSGDGNDETAIEFLPDGRLLAAARLEVAPDSIWGNAAAGTALGVAEPPYTRWTTTRTDADRLDGPALFSRGGRVFAVARRQPGPRGPFTRLGGSFSRKRTALYRVEPGRLVHLSDLPSAGDTSYAGVAQLGGDLFVDYYTSRIDRDYPWLIGMFLPTAIRMARLPVERLLALSDATP